ncbi:hypothetical protein CR205_02250 [Alteribacter lacisalsi]|uniref:DUF4870 domain-containing protein n=1 Tax=Alteribacter lacisalsi TaxID=2045244 RepID=A0A2W0H930_9BACI|nr:DUF4870 domain-containing protein [Alteribacter lacisalsi]PYZ97441.1 hypothetical protein CR205_02250 [Alteribacter lacisalsi]
MSEENLTAEEKEETKENEAVEESEVSGDDKNMALLTHLSGLIIGFIGPLIFWLLKKDTSSFVDYHGKQALNLHISMFIYYTVAAFSMIILVGFLLFPIVVIVNIVLIIMAALKAKDGQYYKMPLTIPFIK